MCLLHICWIRGSRIGSKTYSNGQPDEQIITPGWEVDYKFRTTGKLTETTTSVGSGLQTGQLKRRVERSTPLVGGGFSEHTDTWQRVPVWNTTDTTIVEGTPSGGDKLEHRIGGKFGELVWLGTEGEHFYDEQVQDSYVNGLANELRVGNYRTLPVAIESRTGRDDGIFAGKLTPLAGAGLVWSETERSGSVFTEYDSEGNLLKAEGLFTHQIESGGDAAAEDYEQATRTFGDWNSQREFERTSNDHFRSFRTRTWTPSVSGEGTVDYQSTDAAFEQKFWGSFGESDTRSVQQGSNWRVPETTLTRSGQYGSGAANPLTRSSSGGHALDSGFYDGGFASWGYEGQAIHTRFDSAIAPGSPQSPSAWDDSAWSEMGAGPNLLRQLQDDGGGREDGGDEATSKYLTLDQIIAGYHNKYPECHLFRIGTLSGIQFEMGDNSCWQINYWPKGGSIEVNGVNENVDLIQIDDDWENTPENLNSAVDSIRRYLTYLIDNPSSATAQYAAEGDGDVKAFLDALEQQGLPATAFTRPTNLNPAEVEWLGNGISQIVEFTPFLGFWVATGQLATGQKFSLTLLGQRELSRTEMLVILGSTGGACIIGVATVVGKKYVVKVLGKTDTVAEAVRYLDNAPRGTPNWREFEKLAFGHTPNKETFTLPWTGHSRSWGTRIPDDWVPSTGTIQEATKLNWHEVNLAHPTSQTWKQFTDKLQQATQDGWLLRNDPRVKEVIWYGAEALPTTGRGAELARLLRENGIIYRVVEIPW